MSTAYSVDKYMMITMMMMMPTLWW